MLRHSITAENSVININRILSGSTSERAEMITNDTHCKIIMLVEGHDIVALSYPTVNFQNIKLLQREIISLLKVLGTVYNPVIKFVITVCYPIRSKHTGQWMEILSVSVPAQTLKKFVSNIDFSSPSNLRATLAQPFFL